MQISTLDGVTVPTRPSPGRLTASLVFAGVAHETLRTHGLPHLERICAAIRALPLSRRDHEARVVSVEGGSAAHPGAADSADVADS